MLKKSCLKVQNLQYKFLLENDPPWKFSEKSSVLAPKDKYFFLHFLVCSVCLSFCHVLSSLLGWALKHKARRWKKNKCTHLNCIKAWRFTLGHACQWPAFVPVMMMLNCLCDDDVELSLWWWCRIVLTKRKPGARVTQDALHCIAGSGRRHFLRAPRTFSRLCATFFRERALIRTLFMFGLGCMVGVQK